MTDKPKFLKSTRERFGPHPVSLAKDILYIFGKDAQSKGGRAKAQKNAATLSARDQQIRSDFADGMKSPGAKRHKVVAKLAKKYYRSADRINRILRDG